MIKLEIYAIGRLRAGPERILVDDYLDRAGKTGRGIGIWPVGITEIDDRRAAGGAVEGAMLRAALPDGAVICALDERGRQMTSPDFANAIAGYRDRGTRALAFMIGGADGLDPDLRDQADLALSFGHMVWPHMLARVMLAEQLYRATTILAGGPYHRA